MNTFTHTLLHYSKLYFFFIFYRRFKKIAMLEADLGYGSECDFSDLDEFDGLEALDSPGLGGLDNEVEADGAMDSNGRSALEMNGIEREIQGDDEEEEGDEGDEDLEEDGDDEEDLEDEDVFSEMDASNTNGTEQSTMNIEEVEGGNQSTNSTNIANSTTTSTNTNKAVVENDLTVETATFESKCQPEEENSGIIKIGLNDQNDQNSNTNNSDSRFGGRRPTKSRRRRRRKVRSRRQGKFNTSDAWKHSDFYYSSLLHTCFIVFVTFFSYLKQPQQVFVLT